MKKLLASTLAAAGCLAAASLFAADAKENWDQLCAKCHAADGSGKTKMGQKLKAKDYTDAAVQSQFTDGQLLKVTLEGAKNEAGKELMKAYKDELTEADAKALVAYIRTFKK